MRGAVAALVLLAACSPEARRVRDGGPGADPGNKVLVEWRGPEPRVADTTLWPGRNPPPVVRFAEGQVPPPTFPGEATVPAQQGQRPVTPAVPPSEPQRRTFDGGRTADPRRPSSPR